MSDEKLGGYFLLHRSIDDCSILKSNDPYSKKEAWIDLIMHANYEAKRIYIKGQPVDLKRGQQGRSVVSLAKKWKWSKGKVLRFLNALEDEAMIKQETGHETAHLTTIISVCNYDVFQNGGTPNGTPKRTPDKTPNDTPDETPNGTQQSNINKLNNKNPMGAAKKKPKTQGLKNAFERFWEAYPKKRSKGQAEKTWEKIKPNEQLTEQIISAVEQAKTSFEWSKDAGQFIPNASTWLNAKGWLDELNYSQPGQHSAGSGPQRSVANAEDWFTDDDIDEINQLYANSGG